MAFNERLGERMGRALQPHKVEEVRMFGGLVFMLGGHMCCGIIKDDLLVRVGQDKFAALINKPHASIMDFTGRPMKGFVCVDAKGYRKDADLDFWLDEAVAFAQSLPPKTRKAGSAAKRKTTGREK